MNCMKCGRETENEAVFCPDCLQIMEKYPVRPGTVVILPRRRDPSVLKKIAKRHVVTAEEQVKTLRKSILMLSVMLLVCIIIIILMFKPTMHYLLDEHVEIGQNYSTVTTPNIAPNSTE